MVPPWPRLRCRRRRTWHRSVLRRRRPESRKIHSRRWRPTAARERRSLRDWGSRSEVEVACRWPIDSASATSAMPEYPRAPRSVSPEWWTAPRRPPRGRLDRRPLRLSPGPVHVDACTRRSGHPSEGTRACAHHRGFPERASESPMAFHFPPEAGRRRPRRRASSLTRGITVLLSCFRGRRILRWKPCRRTGTVMSSASPELQPSQVTLKTVFTVALGVLLVAAVVAMLARSLVAVGLAGAALLIAITLEHPVRMLQRRGFKRSLAILTVMLSGLAIAVGFGFLLVPPAIRQGQQLVHNAPGFIETVRESKVFRAIDARLHVALRLQDLERQLPEEIEGAAAPI